VTKEKTYMEPHVFRELINRLKEISITFHDHQSLRDRISHLLSEYITVQGK
jgi:hypothetical protein